jgi:hypothetical protein
MPLMAAGIGAVGSIAGGLIGGKPSTPKYRPFDVTSGLGLVDYDKKGRTIDATLSPEQQAFADQYNQIAQGYLGGGYGGQQAQEWMQQAGGMIPGLFQGSLDASAMDPYSLAAYQQQLGGLQGQLGGMFGGAANYGAGILGGPAPGAAQSNQMFGLGQQLAGNNYNDVYQQRLGLLRQQAQPYEQRAQDSFLGRQYAMGRMGTTGGQRDIEAFSTGLSQGDTTRQLDAMGLAESLYGRDQGLAQGYMGQGLQGILGGFGAQQQAGQGMFGLAGQLGQQLGGLYGQGFGAAQGFNELTNQRAQQRMANATNLFGFGSNVNTQNLQTGTGMQGNAVNLYQQLLGNAGYGHTAGAGAMAGQAYAAQSFQPNALGAGIQAFSNGMLANPAAFGSQIKGLFGGGGAPAPTVGSYAMQPFNVPSGVQNIQMPNFNILPGGGSF